jgi:hypothetical protein
MNKFLILTANIGGKDNLDDPPKKFDNCDYIAVVDREFDSKIWKQVNYLDFSTLDSYNTRRNAKPYKVLSSFLFPKYEYIFWHDANHQFVVNPEDIVNEYGDFDLCLFNHPHRNCIYDELAIIKERNLDTEFNVNHQYSYYIEKDMPRNYGLFEMTAFVKKVNNTNRILDLMWWEQICKFTSRDQCSFPYCLWELKKKQKSNIKTFNGFANYYAGGNIYLIEKEHAK